MNEPEKFPFPNNFNELIVVLPKPLIVAVAVVLKNST